MIIGRKLLYHRSIDDSVATYVTDYILFAECLLFFSYYVYLFVKNRDTPMSKNGYAKSTYGVAALFALVGVGALVAGLTHQFLQTIEPYKGWRENMTWVILWRVAASLSGVVSFVFLLLIEHLLTSEKILNVNRTALIVYYVVSGFACVVITGHSFWILTTEDPWTLLVTFALVFACSLAELIVAAVVLWKRYRTNPHISQVSSTLSSSDTLCLNPDSVEKIKEHKRLAQLMKASETVNNSRSCIITRRVDLVLHFLATLLFFGGGVFQSVLGQVFHCSQGSPSCPIDQNFNHNAIFHVLQILSIAVYFAAELVGVSRRSRLQVRPINSFREIA